MHSFAFCSSPTELGLLEELAVLGMERGGEILSAKIVVVTVYFLFL